MKCRDCKKRISRISIRCKSCSNRHRTNRYKWSSRAVENRKGINNPNWRVKVKYVGLHVWLRRNKPLSVICEECKKIKDKTKLEVANITGIYNRDFKNYKWLCIPCHRKFDRRKRKLNV